MLTSREMTKLVCEALDGKKGSQIKVLHIADITAIAEYFVICSGSSTTQIKALSQEVERILEEQGERPHHIEGYRGGNWVLMDYGCVVVHIFQKDLREFYDLERMWKDGKEVDFSSLIGRDA